MADREYVELMETARDAIRALLEKSDVGSGLDIRAAYNTLERTINKQNRKADKRPERDEQQQREEWHKARIAWKWTPMLERERLAIELIADRRLTVRELAGKLTEARPDCFVYESDARSLVYRLCDAGELDRVGEEWRGRTRYRYFRKVDLEGPIVGLDRAFRDGAGETR